MIPLEEDTLRGDFDVNIAVGGTIWISMYTLRSMQCNEEFSSMKLINI
jgi:hypothetical protein